MRIHFIAVAIFLFLTSFAFAAKDTCFDCHTVIEGMSVVFKDDVHYKYGLSCAACHGGDPTDDSDDSMRADRGFTVRVTREATPEYCGRCHSDAALIRKYKPGQRVDQVKLYRAGVHGKLLAGGNPKAAQCVDCHGIHTIRAVDDPLSRAHPSRVAGTCGHCHAEAAALFRKSPHAAAYASAGIAGCAACHSSHATEPASALTLTGKNAVCARCHQASSAGGKAAAEMGRKVARMNAASRRAAARQAAHALKLSP